MRVCLLDVIASDKNNPGLGGVATSLRRDVHRCRQNEVESGAMAGLAGRPDPATVALDEVLHDGKSKAGAALLARAGLVHAVEALEDSFEGFRRVCPGRRPG